MNIRTDEDGFIKWFESLEDIKPEYTAIKCWHPIQFYWLDGRRTSITKANITPIPLDYLIFDEYVNKYYFRTFRQFDADTFLCYYHGNGKVNTEVENLLRYVYDGTVILLLNEQLVSDMKAMLARVYKSRVAGEGTLKYKDFINIASQTIELEQYKSYGRNLTGFLTVCKQMEDRINAIWREAWNANQKNK
jgi:hypothetical protein